MERRSGKVQLAAVGMALGLLLGVVAFTPANALGSGSATCSTGAKYTGSTTYSYGETKGPIGCGQWVGLSITHSTKCRLTTSVQYGYLIIGYNGTKICGGFHTAQNALSTFNT